MPFTPTPAGVEKKVPDRSFPESGGEAYPA
jgi:hypothetical protein